MKDPRSITSFAEFGLSAKVCGRFPDPTEVQKKMLAVLQSGKSVIARSPPGTGKSVAAVLGLTKCQKGDSLKNLVLVPTGSLAQQYSKTMNSLKIPSKQLYRTGKEYNDEVQHRAFLGGAPTLVATPTRLLDYLNYDRSLLDLTALETIVVDELDVFEKKGKVTGLEVLLEFVLGQAADPSLVVLSSVKRPLEFQQLAKLFEKQSKKRQMLDVSIDWLPPQAELIILDPSGEPLSEQSVWSHSTNTSLDKYLLAMKRVWKGQGIVVVPPAMSPQEIAQGLHKTLNIQALTLHEQDLAGINVPGLENLYILGWEQSYDLEKLLRTPQGAKPTLSVALTPNQTAEDASLLLAAKSF